MAYKVMATGEFALSPEQRSIVESPSAQPPSIELVDASGMATARYPAIMATGATQSGQHCQPST